MAQIELLLRMRRQDSIIALNNVLPANFKLLRNHPNAGWIPAKGVNIDEIANLELLRGPSPQMSSDLHVNVRLTDDWSGWDSPDDITQWFEDNGMEQRDNASAHPRSGRSDLIWLRWRAGPEWADLMTGTPLLRRRIWL